MKTGGHLFVSILLIIWFGNTLVAQTAPIPYVPLDSSIRVHCNPDKRAITVVNAESKQRDFEVMGDGRLYAREIEVHLSDFPDYVFEPAYPLISIDSLHSFILQYRHLPGMPPAREYQKARKANITELLIKQQEKIEELTLYLIQLNQKLEKLEQKLEVLQEKSKH